MLNISIKFLKTTVDAYYIFNTLIRIFSNSYRSNGSLQWILNSIFSIRINRKINEKKNNEFSIWNRSSNKINKNKFKKFNWKIMMMKKQIMQKKVFGDEYWIFGRRIEKFFSLSKKYGEYWIWRIKRWTNIEIQLYMRYDIYKLIYENIRN